MKNKTTRRVYEAVCIQLVFLLIIGAFTQASVGIEIESEKNIESEPDFEGLPKNNDKNYMVRGSGEIYYIYPENLDNFVGEDWNGDNSYGIDGWITDTNINVINYWSFMIYEPAYLFILSFKPLRLFFRFILPKEFTIESYTGEIYCNYYNIPHGPCGVVYKLSGGAEGIKTN